MVFNRYWSTVKAVKWPGCVSDQALLSATKVQIQLKYISGFNMYVMVLVVAVKGKAIPLQA
jgi:hypothetical protein